MLVPYGVDNPMRRLPLMNWALIAANVALFGLQVYGEVDITVYGTVPAHLRWYQPLTSAFLHSGIVHLAMNMIFLWTFGNNVNDKLGHWRYLGLYLVFAYASDLGHALMATGLIARVPCIGASGAVFGVVGAYLAFYPINDVKMWYFLFIFMGTFRCSAFWIIGFYVAWDVYHAVNGTAGAVAVFAHLTGFAAGLAAGMLFLRRNWVERDDYDLLARLTGRHKWAKRFSRSEALASVAPADEDTERRALADRMRRHLASQVEARQLEAACETYRGFVRTYPGEALDSHTHIELANWLLKARRLPEAAAALHHFAVTHPRHEQAADALYSAGVLYVRHLAQPQRGRALLSQAARLLMNPEKASRAAALAQAAAAETRN